MKTDLPPHTELADAEDELDWNVERDGRMVEYATDDVPPSVPYNPDTDPFLQEG